MHSFRLALLFATHLLVGFSPLGLFAQKVDYNAVPPVIRTRFLSMFSGQKADWTRDGKTYSASFEYGKKQEKKTVVISNLGVWVRTETIVPFSTFPLNVRQDVTREERFQGSALLSVWKVEVPNDEFFVMIIKTKAGKEKRTYSKAGALVETAKE
jgi:hypothetical protein